MTNQIRISKILILIGGLLIALTIFVAPLNAQEIGVETELGGRVTTIGKYLGEVIKWAARIGTVAAVLVIVYAGNSMITSGGSPEKVGEAKELIQGALLGLIVIFLIGAFLTFFVDISQFNQ